MHPTWNAPELKVAGDDARRAKYRLLQSWYREIVLRQAPGSDGTTLRPNLLPAQAVEADPSLNFLRDAAIANYAVNRADLVMEAGGTVDEDRLKRNMLSSMPLCFNVFGKLRAEREAAARVLSALFSLPIAAIDEIEVEWTPEEHPLRDRTAFDAWISYRTEDGRRGFLGVETKYTEPFSEREYPVDRYQGWNDMPESGFVPGSADVLSRRVTNQLWRNALLAVAVRTDGRWDLGHVAVLALDGDPGVKAAVEGLRSHHQRPDELLRAATLENLVALARAEPTLAAWATAFEQRYLDLSPVR